MPRRMVECCDCGQKLKKDEVALSKKMLGRDTIEFMCTICLADYLSCEKHDLEVKIKEFKEQGCALFF